MRVLCFFFSLFLGLSAQFDMRAKEPPADTFAPGTFPIIEVGRRPVCTVRIASFNVRCADVNGVPDKARKTIVLKQIADLAADSIGLQEVTLMWKQTLEKMPGYAAVGEGRDGESYGESSLILYNKLRYTCTQSGTFWLSETPDVVSFGWDAACRRVCTYVVLKNRWTGETYAHVNSHFDHMGKQAVVQEAQMVSDFIRDNFGGMPVVFTADLNAQPDSEPYRIMTETLYDSRLCADDVQTYGTFHAVKPETHAQYYIDYVLCSAQVHALAYRTVTAGECGRFVSDHFPIYADLRFDK